MIIGSRSRSLKIHLLQSRRDVHALAYHYQGVHGECSLTLRQDNDRIQVHFRDIVAQVVGKPRQPRGHFGKRADIGRRRAAHAGEDFRAFEIFQSAACFAHFIAGHYEEALASGQAATRIRPNYQLAMSMVAASAALAGQPEEARKAVERLLKLKPGLRVADAPHFQLMRRPQDIERWADALRRAGLPD